MTVLFNYVHVLYLFYGIAGAEYLLDSHFGPSTSPIYMDDIMCVGHELKLEDCPMKMHGDMNCGGHLEEAGVRCKPMGKY